MIKIRKLENSKYLVEAEHWSIYADTFVEVIKILIDHQDKL